MPPRRPSAPTPEAQQPRLGVHAGIASRVASVEHSSECANHCARHTAEKFAGALQAQGAAPRIPLSLWRRPLSPVVNRDTKASRLELTARSPGGTTVAEGAQSRGELGCPQSTCSRHVNHCARGPASVETPKGLRKRKGPPRRGDPVGSRVSERDNGAVAIKCDPRPSFPQTSRAVPSDEANLRGR